MQATNKKMRQSRGIWGVHILTWKTRVNVEYDVPLHDQLVVQAQHLVVPRTFTAHRHLQILSVTGNFINVRALHGP